MAYEGYHDPTVNPSNHHDYSDHHGMHHSQTYSQQYPDSQGWRQHDTSSPRPDLYPSDHVRINNASPRRDNGYPPPPPDTYYSEQQPYLRLDPVPSGRSRSNSTVRPDNIRSEPPRYPEYSGRPANETAVAVGGHKTGSSGVDVNPELVAQITEQVIQNLKATGINKSSSPPTLSRSNSSEQSNLPGQTSTSNREIHTPPSPSSRVASPKAVSPPPQQNPSVPPSSARNVKESISGRTGERYLHPPGTEEGRPQAPRMPSDNEETPLDKTWGRLFDEDGKATCRLGQLLRGLANHIIEQFEPCNSIVVTPTKMAKYYEKVKIQSELYHWEYFFKRMSSSELSRLYQTLECQHHLVQDHHGNVPTIPGLTPVGFERWMTLLILAWPEEEMTRLQTAILNMPISNADDPKERFPKHIRRRLFPDESDRKVQAKLERIFPTEAREQSRTTKSDHSRGGTESSRLASKLERERHPYSGTPSESVMHDQPSRSERNREREFPAYNDTFSATAVEEPPMLSTNIERERKPYVARPGGGKEYSDTDSKSTIPERAHSTRNRRKSMAQGSGSGGGGGLEIPVPETSHRHHRTSTSGVKHSTSTRQRRGRSPPLSSGGGDFRRSDNDLSLGGGGGGSTSERGRDRDRDRDPVVFDPADPFPDDQQQQRRLFARHVPHEESFSPPPPASHHGGHHYQPQQFGGGGIAAGGQQDYGFDSPRGRERYDRLADSYAGSGGVGGVGGGGGGPGVGGGNYNVTSPAGYDYPPPSAAGYSAAFR